MVKQWMICIGILFTPLVFAEVINDPTRPWRSESVVESVTQEDVTYQVSSIIKRRVGSSAIVNGQQVEVGDVIEGARVQKIERGRVLLQIKERQHWVVLSQVSGLKKSR